LKRLLIRPGGIGDLIVSLPALESLCATYTEVWTAGPNTSLVRFADRVRPIGSTGLDLLELGKAPQPLKRELEGFDEIWSWYGTGREEFRDAVRDLPFRFLQTLPGVPGLHACDFYLQQAGAEPGAAPRIQCPVQPADYAVIHPFSGGERKNWPLKEFRSLAEALEARMPVYWCAGPEEKLDDARRFDDLYQLGCWLAGARVYIGNDSGITHLAAAVGAPVVALFGPTDPQIWGPRGPSVRILHHQPLDELRPEAVLHCIQCLDS
jgi:heptosyltransferase-3